jgi:hypothetical protein
MDTPIAVFGVFGAVVGFVLGLVIGLIWRGWKRRTTTRQGRAV